MEVWKRCVGGEADIGGWKMRKGGWAGGMGGRGAVSGGKGRIGVGLGWDWGVGV